MKNGRSLRVLAALLLIVAITLVLFFGRGQADRAQTGNNTIALKPPAFLEAARASDDASTSAIASVLDSEAGIAAYAQTTPFTLSTIRSLFTTIEHETADYLLGTIAVPNNWDDFDVHVYANKAGWVLTYYLRIQPAVMVFDWQNFTASPGPPTRFQTVVNLITGTLNRADLTLTYYDFRYPNATNLMIAVQYVTGNGVTECFTIQDTSWLYHERSWLLGGYTASETYYVGDQISWYKLDGVEISRISGTYGHKYRTGFLDGTQLPPDAQHTVCVFTDSRSNDGKMMGALSLVYGPQP